MQSHQDFQKLKRLLDHYLILRVIALAQEGNIHFHIEKEEVQDHLIMKVEKPLPIPLKIRRKQYQGLEVMISHQNLVYMVNTKTAR